MYGGVRFGSSHRNPKATLSSGHLICLCYIGMPLSKKRASSKVEAIRVMVITTLFAITVLEKRHNLIFLEFIDSSCDVIDGKFPAAIFE